MLPHGWVPRNEMLCRRADHQRTRRMLEKSDGNYATILKSLTNSRLIFFKFCLLNFELWGRGMGVRKAKKQKMCTAIGYHWQISILTCAWVIDQIEMNLQYYLCCNAVKAPLWVLFHFIFILLLALLFMSTPQSQECSHSLWSEKRTYHQVSIRHAWSRDAQLWAWELNGKKLQLIYIYHEVETSISHTWSRYAELWLRELNGKKLQFIDN